MRFLAAIALSLAPAFAAADFQLSVSMTQTEIMLPGSVQGGPIQCNSSPHSRLPGPCSATVAAGTTITLTATPGYGFEFLGWSGAGCSGTGDCAVTVDADKAVTANFAYAPGYYGLGISLAVSGGDGGIARSAPGSIECGRASINFFFPCAEVFPSGTQVTLTAEAYPDSYFAGWSGGGCSGLAPCTVTIDSHTTVQAAFALSTSRLVNISTRGWAGTGNDVLIGGFIIGGTTAKNVVVRARGPSLTAAGVPGALANPVLSLYSGQTVIASNDDWQSAANASTLQASGFAPPDAQEAAVYATLDPGAYTAIAFGAGGTTGIGLVEVFEVDAAGGPLVNISTRGRVFTGDNVMIGGFIIDGSTPRTVVVRARGPSLSDAGVPNVLADPVLTLYSGQTPIASNDDWQTASNASTIQSRGFAPTDSREAAIYIMLNPGAYTAIVSGAGGTTGIGIIEVFRFQ